MKTRAVPLLLLAVLLLLSTPHSSTALNRRRTTTSNDDLKDRSEYLVEGLDKIEPAFGTFHGLMYAGLIPFDNTNYIGGGNSADDDDSTRNSDSDDRQGELMFWLFLPHQESDSMVLWLNGGPGCSSFDAGVAFETAPVTVPLHPAGYCCSGSTPPLQVNPNGWTNAPTAMLYIEQPAGTGFSNGPTPLCERDLSGDMYSFLQNFFSIFDELGQRQFHIFGESYAGMFVPSIARRIHLENKALLLLLNANDDDVESTSTAEGNDDGASSKNLPIVINLAGIALGNGWMDAMVQGPTVIEYAYWHGMIDAEERTALKKLWKVCQMGGVEEAPLHPFTIPDECGIMGKVLDAAGRGQMTDRAPNTYDVTTWDMYPVLDSDDPDTTFNVFFNKEAVKTALHAPLDVEWRGCIPGAGRRRLALLDNDYPKSVAPYLAFLMDDAKIRILIYNGDRDMSTNAPGTEMVLNEMTEWSGHNLWRRATRGLWIDTENEMAGWAKEHKLLTYLVVYNSGHLVPHNQPTRSLELLRRFLSNTTFVDKEIPRITSPEMEHKTTHTPVAEQRRRAGTLIMGVIGLFIAIVGGYEAYARSQRRKQYMAMSS